MYECSVIFGYIEVFIFHYQNHIFKNTLKSLFFYLFYYYSFNYKNKLIQLLFFKITSVHLSYIYIIYILRLVVVVVEL